MPQPRSKRPEHGSEGQRIAASLRESISRGLLPPGTPLVQNTLAKSMNASRIPVRDALQILAAEGLVTVADGRTYVTALTVEEIDELYTLRLLIEPALAQPIVSNHTGEERNRLGELVERMSAQEAAGDREGWSRANLAFHDVLCGAAHRPHFHRAARQLHILVESYSRTATFHLGGWSKSQREHKLMLKAIDNSDPEELRRLLEVHLERARHDLIEFTSHLAAREREAEVDRATAEAERIAELVLGNQ